MEIDAAQYAEISWEMHSTHNFLQPHCLTHNYLDKPPLLFWLSAFSFSVFGVNNFAYKLPAFLFALLAVFSVYRLAKIYYNEKTARMAALMLAGSQAMFLITNDVRTDTILMGAVIFSIWQLSAFFEKSKTHNLLLGSIGIGLALLTKGPIGLVATGAALAPHFILKGMWKRFLDARLMVGAILIAVLLTPMCIGLYQQFGITGLKFYFWTQSFGRITGESEWNNHPDTFFLLHTTAWAFLPWSLFLVLGWGNAIFSLIRNKFKVEQDGEIISVIGFTLVLIMLSLSKYQLPHYIFVVYPLAAIMAANGFMQLASWPKARPWVTALQLIVLASVVIGSCLIQYSLMGTDIISAICLIAVFSMAIWAAIKADGGIKTFDNVISYVSYRFRRFYQSISDSKSNSQLAIVFGLDMAYKKLFFISVAIFIALNFLLSVFYYPAILKYQPENDMGRYVKNHAGNSNFVFYDAPLPGFAVAFYAQQIPAYIGDVSEFKKMLNEKKDLLVYASDKAKRQLDEEHINYQVIEERESYTVSLLSFSFINPSTRASVCSKVYLLDAKL